MRKQQLFLSVAIVALSASMPIAAFGADQTREWNAVTNTTNSGAER